MKNYTTHSLILALTLMASILFGQSPYVRFFRLHPREADYLYHHPAKKPDSTFFHTPISPTQAEHEMGHYLKVSPFGESAYVTLYTNSPIRVQVLNNRHDLSILVKDTLGQNLSSAEVFLDQKKIRYDSVTQSFHCKRSPKTGVLEVRIPSHSTYYELERQGRKTPILAPYDRFASTSVGRLITWPLRVLSTPVRYVARSIRARHWRLPWKHWFSRNYNRELQGYIALSQPIYRIGDTLKMKAYVTAPGGRPLNAKLELNIAQRWPKQVLNKTIEPEKPGVYIFDWPLADTLDIDRDYYISITHPGHEQWSNLSQPFRLEAYELDEIKYELNLATTTFQRGEKCILTLSAQTTNGLSIPDAEAEIFLLAGAIHRFHAEQVAVPDTLWHSKESLGVRGEWRLVLPDSLFPEASLDVRCHVYFNNSAGQLDFKEKVVKFLNQSDVKLSLDKFEVVASSTSNSRDSLMVEEQLYGGEKRRKKILPPVRFPLDPDVAAYLLLGKTPDALFTLDLQKEDHRVALAGQRSHDSIHLSIQNPRRLPLWYQIKTSAGLVEEGFTRDTAWFWQRRDVDASAYHLFYQYLWAGEVFSENQEFRHYSKALSIKLEGPDRVIPGQENNYQIRVTRSSGRPARGVDLSAGAINAQFGPQTSYSAPNIGFRKQLLPRVFPRFELNTLDPDYNLPMSRFLVQTFHLQDTLYYQYRYNRQLLSERRDSSMQRDSFYQSIAQFAPYVVKGGKMQPIYLIYANRKLLYYYDTQDNQPYSFVAPAGSNKIVIRTREHEYILDSVQLRKGEKLELVINEDYWPSGQNPVKIGRLEKPNYFSDAEKNLVNRSIFALHQIRAGDSIFIWDHPQNIHFATYQSGGHYHIGPFASGASLSYVNINHFKKSFVFEPGFSYDVAKTRERLYEYKVLPDLKKQPLLPKTIPHPAIGQSSISPRSVRAFSPPRRSILFDKIPGKEEKLSGKYQFAYPASGLQPDSTRLLMVLIRNEAKGQKWTLAPSTRSINNLPAGIYELLLFSETEAVFRKSIQIRRDTLLFEDLSNIRFSKVDSLLPSILGENYVPIQSGNSTSLSNDNYNGRTQLIRGRILDDSGEPLIGAAVMVKGTSIGAVTDIDGYYSLPVPFGAYTLVTSYTGYTTQEIDYDAGRRYGSTDFTLNAGASLSEVVVTGLGTMPTKNLSRTVALTAGNVAGIVAGVNVKGSRSATEYYLDGVSIRGGKSMDTILSYAGIRSSFHDHAFWQPRLRSNRYGEAQFKVKFPDDITNWKTFVIGADKNRQAGLYTGNIQSYKPLMAQLNLPRFLVHGDRTTLNGKVLNYTNDTFALLTHFQAADQRIYEKQNQVKEGLVEKSEYQAPSRGDSLQFRYALETAQGYTDGEQRKIPLLPIGTLEADGVFLLIERDTMLNFGNKTGQIKFRAQPSTLPLLLEDLQYLRDYPYACNEQTASKLIGLLSEKQIRQALNQTFTGEKMIREAVTRLGKAQNPDGSWGWWPNGSANEWMSNYVLRALSSAQQAGFSSSALESGLRWLSSQWPSQRETARLQSLQTLLLAGQKIDSTGLRDSLAKPQKLLCDRLLSVWIQQELGYKPALDTLFKYRKLDTYGGAFWEEKTLQDWTYHWNNNRIANTLLAYEIAKKAGLTEEIKRIRLHLLARRGYTHHGMRLGNGWRNTLEVASVIKTILPELTQGNHFQVGALKLSGALEGTVDKQALEATFTANSSLKLTVTGSGPFFCTAYQEFWNTNPTPKADLFAVSSHLEEAGETIRTLQFGKAAQLVAEVDVKQEGQYVMIEIPIPAGCSYGEKSNSYRFPEVHREYFAEKVSIFCEHLPVGKHRFVVNLEPRYSGAYTLNPVRVEEMYFPTLYGRNSVETLKIRP